MLTENRRSLPSEGRHPYTIGESPPEVPGCPSRRYTATAFYPKLWHDASCDRGSVAGVWLITLYSPRFISFDLDSRIGLLSGAVRSLMARGMDIPSWVLRSACLAVRPQDESAVFNRLQQPSVGYEKPYTTMQTPWDPTSALHLWPSSSPRRFRIPQPREIEPVPVFPDVTRL